MVSRDCVGVWCSEALCVLTRLTDAPADTIASDSKLDEVDKPVLARESLANK